MKKFVINHPKNKSNKIFLVGCTRIGCVLSQSTYKKAYNIFVVQCIRLFGRYGDIFCMLILGRLAIHLHISSYPHFAASM